MTLSCKDLGIQGKIRGVFIMLRRSAAIAHPQAPPLRSSPSSRHLQNNGGASTRRPATNIQGFGIGAVGEIWEIYEASPRPNQRT